MKFYERFKKKDFDLSSSIHSFELMKKGYTFSLGFYFTCALFLTALAQFAFSGALYADSQKQTRKISVQTYTFRNCTLEQTMAKLSSLGVKAMECYPEQLLSEKYPGVRVDASMGQEARAYLKNLMKETGVYMKSYGCIMSSPRDKKKLEMQISEICEFAKDMGVEQIQTEAKFSEIPVWIRHAKPLGLSVGVHHHAINARNNQYYRPEVLLDLANRFEIEILCDTGHWARSGLQPVPCLKMLKGKFKFGIHFKDLDKFGELENFKGVAYGTGVLDAKSMLAELDAQGFDGYFIIENEQIYDDPMPVVKRCVEWLREN